jgi:hypothetical protein
VKGDDSGLFKCVSKYLLKGTEVKTERPIWIIDIRTEIPTGTFRIRSRTAELDCYLGSDLRY